MPPTIEGLAESAVGLLDEHAASAEVAIAAIARARLMRDVLFMSSFRAPGRAHSTMQSRLGCRMESHQDKANIAPRRMSPRMKMMMATTMPTARIATPVRANVMVARRRPPPALKEMRAWALV